MLIQDLIATRRTAFQFQDQAVPAESITRALTAAHWAPNHKHTWPWRFMVPGPEMKKKLRAYFALKLEQKLERRGITGEEAQRILTNSQKRQEKMPAQIIVYAQQNGSDHQNREDYASACCAVQNLTLSLWAEGIASGWKTFDSPEAYALTELDKDEYVLVGLIQAGYPLTTTQPRVGTRPPLANYIIQTA